MPSTIPRPEHPRPQWFRPDWRNLNGEWEFEIDRADSGWERGVAVRPLADTIIVPFAPESEASGIADTDFMESVWYRREIHVPAEWADRRVLLNFQAVDHDTTVWVDGMEVGRHRGGFTPFSIDITDVVHRDSASTVVVRARDSSRGVQARGKQATWYANTHCFYTRTTGIWQTVWMEAVGRSYLKRPRVTPDVAGSRFHIDVPVMHATAGMTVTVRAFSGGREVAADKIRLGVDMSIRAVLNIPTADVRLWSPGNAHLYDLTFELTAADGTVIDRAESSAGLRGVAVDKQRVLINGEPVFQRLVLDQGYWPETLMTAPSDAALVRDIELALEAGFNGARLHQKIFEERYLHHADRMGYMVWGEFPDWGAGGQGPQGDNQRPDAAFVAEWLEALERDRSHPSIVGWCPLNETIQTLHDRFTVLDDVTAAMFRAAKLSDGSRPVIDASGYSHRVADTDVWDSHLYEQDPVEFARLTGGLAEGRPFEYTGAGGTRISLPYAGQPYMVSEFGGIWWNSDRLESSGENKAESWGYGQRVRSIEAFFERFEGLTSALLDNPLMFGYCYTQLTDVFQEENGLYAFDRTPKFPIERIRAIQSRTAAYERAGVREEVAS